MDHMKLIHESHRLITWSGGSSQNYWGLFKTMKPSDFPIQSFIRTPTVETYYIYT